MSSSITIRLPLAVPLILLYWNVTSTVVPSHRCSWYGSASHLCSGAPPDPVSRRNHCCPDNSFTVSYSAFLAIDLQVPPPRLSHGRGYRATTRKYWRPKRMSFPPAPLCCSLKHEHKRTPPSQFQGTAEFLFQRFHIAGHKVGRIRRLAGMDSPVFPGPGYPTPPVSHGTD